MIEKPPINVGLYSVYQDGENARHGRKGISSRGFNQRKLGERFQIKDRQITLNTYHLPTSAFHSSKSL
jgi:hypothetical protein